MAFQFLQGAGHAFRGFRLLKQPGVKKFVVIPILINVVLFGGIIWFGGDKFDYYLDHFLPSWLDWARFILWPLFALTAVLIVFSTFTLIANVFGAPFNSILSEKIERQLDPAPATEPTKSNAFLVKLTSEIQTSIFNEIRKLLYFALRGLPLLILFLIPGVNLIAPLVWFLFTSWMLALEYLDYPMGNNGMNFKQERALIQKQRFLALGFGAGIMILTIIPGLNFFAMPVGVAGATSMWVTSLKPKFLSPSHS